MHDLDVDTTFIEQDVIDALLTDFVNFCGVNQCLDYAMYARDLVRESQLLIEKEHDDS